MTHEMRKVLSRFFGKKIWVIGDLMLDEYISGNVSRISPEAPVPIFEAKKQHFVLGGASNVAHNITSLGGDVFLSGVIGADLAADSFRKALNEGGMSDRFLVVDSSRPTTQKTRIIAMQQQMLRLDRESKEPVSKETEDKLCAALEHEINSVDAIILSDYAKGVVSETLAQRVIALAKQYDKLIAVDPKGHNYRKYRGATVLSPNQKEVETVLNVAAISSEAELFEAGNRLREDLALKSLLITRGEKGMTLFQDSKEPLTIASSASDVFDVTGAGDTVLGTLVLALAADATWEQAAQLANFAAGVVVRKLGTATTTCTEISEMFT